MSVSDHDRAGELLIQEVDEDLRREYYEKLWKSYGHWAIAGALSIVLIVAGYQGWRSWDHAQRQKEATTFQSAGALAAQGKTKDAMDAFARLAAEGRSGVAMESLMARAQLATQSGDTAAALASYEQLAKSSAPQLYRDLAVLKAGQLALDGGELGAYEPRIGELAAPANPWHAQATELLAAAALKKGDAAKAAGLFKSLSDDATAPEGLRGRAAQMLAALGQDKTKQ